MAQLAMLGGGGGLGSLLMPLFASTIGMFLQPGQKDEQGKLNDLKVSSSAYGEGIAIVYGTMRVPGNMFWATDFEEEKKYINSKGKDVTNKKKADKKGEPVYTYYANYAMGLSEGPVGEVLRIWADSNLIFDKYNVDDEDVVGPGFSNPDDGSGSKVGKGGLTGKKGGGESASFNFSFHNGSEGQSVEPHMLEKNGSRGTPAHRGMCYLYFKRFALADFGNRIPTITAEISREHDRKPRFIYFTQLTAGGNIPPLVAGLGSMFFDPIRLRAYTGGGGNDNIRVWDLTKQAEIGRKAVSDITGIKVIQVDHPNQDSITIYDGIAGGYYNGPESGVDLTCTGIYGIAASGDLIGTAGGSGNSRTIVFIDPDTFIIKSRFGRWGLSTKNSTYAISAMNKSTILSSFDPITQVPVYYTVIQSFQGDFYFFDDENKPVGYHNIGGLGSIAGNIAPGIPNIGGSSFYVNNSGNLISGKPAVTINRFDWIQQLGGFVTKGIMMFGLQQDVNSMEIAPTKTLNIYTSAVEDDETGHYSTLVYPILGSQSIAFLEVVAGNTVNPEKNGTYAVKVAYAPGIDGTFEVLWRFKFSDDSTTFITTLNKAEDSVILTAHKLILRRTTTEVWEIDFTQETVDIWYVPVDVPVYEYTQFYFPVKGTIYQESVPPSGGWTILEASMDRLVQKKVTAAEVLKDLADRVNIGAEKVDVSKLNSDKINGYLMQQPKAARRIAEDLMRVFFFDIVESDYTLKAVSRSQGVSIVTVTQRDLGLIRGNTAGDNVSDYYKETQVQEIDLPRTVMVSYIDAEDDYQNGSQHWRRPASPMSVMQSREVLDLNIPMAMKADFAKQIAQKITYSAWAERSSYEFALPWKYIKYDPTDIMTFVMNDGLTFISRMGDMDLGQDFSIRAKGVASIPASYDSTVTAQGNGTSIPVPTIFPPHVRAIVLDVPYFEDTDSVGDSGWAYYWGLRAYGAGFKFGALSDKALPSGDFNPTGQTAFDVVWGSVSTLIPPPPVGPEYTDNTTTITLFPAFDFSLNTGMMSWVDISDANWPSHDNTLIIGGEIIYFKNSTVNANGTITVDTLIRGARGTRDAAYSHIGISGNWVFKAAGIDQEMEDFSDVNKEYLFRPIAPAVIPAALPVTRKLMTGASHKPWAPNDIRRTNSGGDIIISWQRSSRLGGTLAGGTGTVPNVEGELQFEVYVLSAPYNHVSFDPDDAGTYIRKFGPVTPEQVTYAAVDIGTDGLTQASPLYLIVLQRNQFVGRGFYGWATLII